MRLVDKDRHIAQGGRGRLESLLVPNQAAFAPQAALECSFATPERGLALSQGL